MLQTAASRQIKEEQKISIWNPHWHPANLSKKQNFCWGKKKKKAIWKRRTKAAHRPSEREASARSAIDSLQPARG